jgi:hypothetical protein
LIKGIGEGKRDAKFIHISGTGIMNDTSNGVGNESQRVYHDMNHDDVQEILSFDDSHIHRDVEDAIVSSAKEHGVTAAIISPPMIHGVGAGPLKKRSIQVPILIDAILKRGKAFQVMEGNNVWNSMYHQNRLSVYP